MHQRLTPLLLLCASCLLAACSANGPKSQSALNVDDSVYGTATESHMTASAQDDDDPANFDLSQHPHDPLPGDNYQIESKVERLLKAAMALKGTPYTWGGGSPDSGFDCSGFLRYVYNEATGIALPRTTRDLIKMPIEKVARKSLRPGDLIFFNADGRGRVNHVGMYLGSNKFIHSNHTGGSVRIDSLKTSYWQRSYIEAKRILDNDDS